MLSIIYFLFFLAPYAVITLLIYLKDMNLVDMFIGISLPFWAKFFIAFGFYIFYYLIIRLCINRFNGYIKRKVFFPLSYIMLAMIIASYGLLFYFNVITPQFNLWTITFLGYFAFIELWALIFALIRTCTDGKYHCSHCDRFGKGLMVMGAYSSEHGSYDKEMLDVHSREVYEGTTVTTKTEWTEEDGREVSGSRKSSSSSQDHYRTEYYTTPRTVRHTYTTTSGTVHCKKCGATSNYYDIHHNI